MKLSKAVGLVGLCILVSSCEDSNPHLQTLKLNYEGNVKLKAQVFSVASQSYLQALRFDPFAEPLHLNLGLSLEGLQQAEDAMASYRASEKLAHQNNNKVVEFMSLFNQGQLLGKGKKVDEALAVYQRALELHPASKEVKHNIELLTQQQGQGGGQGDPKDSQGQGQGQDQNQNQDPNKDQQKKPDQPKEFKQSPKYQPRPFQGKELTDGDVKKILGELKQQEEKIRAEYNKKEMKEQPRDKDW